MYIGSTLHRYFPKKSRASAAPSHEICYPKVLSGNASPRGPSVRTHTVHSAAPHVFRWFSREISLPGVNHCGRFSFRACRRQVGFTCGRVIRTSTKIPDMTSTKMFDRTPSPCVDRNERARASNEAASSAEMIRSVARPMNFFPRECAEYSRRPISMEFSGANGKRPREQREGRERGGIR